MKNEDILKKYMAWQDQVLVYYIDATKMVSDARKVHQLSNVATAAMGRTLMMATIMSGMLKEKDYKITVQVKGNGILEQIVICGNGDLKMKGYVKNPKVELPLNEQGKLDVKKAVGSGMIHVVKDIGLKDPYSGTSKIVSGEIAEDFAHYFVVSEQSPCAVSLGVKIGINQEVEKACGYVIMPLPKCEESVIATLEQINNSISSVTDLSLDLEKIDDVVKTITGDNKVQWIEERKPSYECDCNEDRITKVIVALGKQEAMEALENNKGILELTCNFCNQVYQYNKEEVENIFKKG